MHHLLAEIITVIFFYYFETEPNVPTSGLYTFDKIHYDVTEGDAAVVQICRAGDLAHPSSVCKYLSDSVESNLPKTARQKECSMSCTDTQCFAQVHMLNMSGSMQQ